MASVITLNAETVKKCIGGEKFYQEAIEHAASFNTRLQLERRMRLPFLDSQTGVAQSHTDLWHPYRHRQPGKFHGQIYTYPAKRWKKKKHFFLFSEVRPAKAMDIETGEAESTNIKKKLRSFNETGPSRSSSYRKQLKVKDPEKYALYLEKQKESAKKRRLFLKKQLAEKSPVAEAQLRHQRELARVRQALFRERHSKQKKVPMTVQLDMHQISTVENPALARGEVDEFGELKSESSKDRWYDDYDEYDEPPDAGEVCDDQSDISDYEETYIKKKKKKTNRGRKKKEEKEKIDEEKDKPYACEACGARYKTRPGLAYHYTHFHNGMIDEAPEPTPESTGRGEDGKVSANNYCDFCLGDAAENKKTCAAEELVSCSDCGRSGHPTCLQFTPNMIVSVKKYPWQCIECKSCGLCGTSDNDDQLLFCDDCDRGYHMYCLNPPLAEPPEGNWSCHLCIEEFHGGKKPAGMQ